MSDWAWVTETAEVPDALCCHTLTSLLSISRSLFWWLRISSKALEKSSDFLIDACLDLIIIVKWPKHCFNDSGRHCIREDKGRQERTKNATKRVSGRDSEHCFFWYSRRMMPVIASALRFTGKQHQHQPIGLSSAAAATKSSIRMGPPPMFTDTRSEV